MTTAKNGLLAPLQKAIVAWRTQRGALAALPSWPTSWLARSGTRERAKNPATRTFQALRIFINAELEELQRARGQPARAGARRPPGGDQFSLAGRSHRQAVHRPAFEVFDRRAPFAAPCTCA